jgi:hypothetical protein
MKNVGFVNNIFCSKAKGNIHCQRGVVSFGWRWRQLKNIVAPIFNFEFRFFLFTGVLNHQDELLMNPSELQSFYSSVRNVSEAICRPLETEDYVVQPMDDVSPPKWHLGHTTWFFETVLLQKFQRDYKPFHKLYNFIFNSYYESFGTRVARPKRGSLSRPTVKEIYAYRAVVDEQMAGLFVSIDAKHWPEFSHLVTLGLNHEQQHQELLVYDIKYILATIRCGFIRNRAALQKLHGKCRRSPSIWNSKAESLKSAMLRKISRGIMKCRRIRFCCAISNCKIAW